MAVRNRSKKREAILEKLQSTKAHPTAEWIYQELKSEYPEISLATVYRNLRMFQESGEIASVGTVKGQERFDATTDCHGHFICESCDAVIDIDIDFGAGATYQAVADNIGAEIASHNVMFFGKCGKCK